ncbi:ABC transporter permease [Rhodovulum sp. DZ06]|uniref:ABC transporter permease n=1 Tax=Rhodovulum sp. DZ06 TaxID=3425126 RepID=UPI003D3372A5
MSGFKRLTGLRNALISAAVLLAAWALAVELTGVKRFILPGPDLVAETFWKSRALIAEHAVYTLAEVAAGLALGLGFGAATALLLAQSSAGRIVLRPILVFSQALPFFALAPLLTLWMGFGAAPKITMAVLFIFFPVTSAFYDGLTRTPPALLDMARVMGASERAVLWRLKIPAALPGLGSGLRLAAVYAPLGAVIGEWVGAGRGLGYLMLLANGRVKTDLLFAAVITVGVMSVTLYLLASVLADRMERWAEGRLGEVVRD